MKRKFLSIAVVLTVLCPLRAEAQLLEPINDIYWQNEEGIYSDSGVHQYEEAHEETTCSVPDDFTLLPGTGSAVEGKPVIAIVIDDMGVDRKRSARAALLPPQVTLAYLPYSPKIREQTDAAKQKGHELIVHVPMAPERKSANPGPDYLSADLSPLELHERIVKNLSAFDSYVGVNNHMGSAFTPDRDGMNVLMTELKSRKLVFLDSKTAVTTVGEKAAREAGVPVTHRDVFIDHFEDPARVAKALAQIEKIAKHTGSAVAIGHPKDVTLDALEKWLPGLAAKGFQLVSITEAISLRQKPDKLPARQAGK